MPVNDLERSRVLNVAEERHMHHSPESEYQMGSVIPAIILNEHDHRDLPEAGSLFGQAPTR
jgi:hypothetical protein